MIPKVIHYIWLGGKPLPKIAEKCIKSWKKYCPDYEIKRWDESNININLCKYTSQAYEAKKYAFVADVARFDILQKEGGIYLDIDVELVASLDPFLNEKAIMGFETESSIAPGLILACEKNNPIIKYYLDTYINDEFINSKGEQNLETICQRVTNHLVKNGLKLNNQNQKVLNFSIYSSDYFCAKSLTDGVIRKTKNTVAVHHYFGSWIKKSTKIKTKILQICKRILGPKLVTKIKNKRKKNESSTSFSKQ